MSSGDFEQIFAALQENGVRYLVVGGVAVVLHGYPRFTADLDLVLSLTGDNVRSAIKALSTLGYRPRAPVAMEDFADLQTRLAWMQEKQLTVFSLWSVAHPATEIDLFVEEPFPFEEAFARAVIADIGGVKITVVSIEDLKNLKRQSARPKDWEDIRALEALMKGRKDD